MKTYWKKIALGLGLAIPVAFAAFTGNQAPATTATYQFGEITIDRQSKEITASFDASQLLDPESSATLTIELSCNGGQSWDLMASSTRMGGEVWENGKQITDFYLSISGIDGVRLENCKARSNTVINKTSLIPTWKFETK